MKTVTFLRKSIAVVCTALIGTALLTGCGKSDKNDESLIRVGVCAGPYGDMFNEAIKPALEEKGYKIEMTEFSDYVQPNMSLADDEIDVNMFQHSTYLKKFCEEHSLELEYISEIPTASMGIFSDKHDSLDDVSDGGEVAVPNDDTNYARALRVLEQTGLITLNPEIDASTATVADIVENPKNLKFTEVSAEILPSVLDSVDLAVINGNYAIGAGLKLDEAVYNEELGEGYYNVIAVRSEDADKQFAKDIVSIVHSDDFRNVIEDGSKQYTAFARPADYNN